MRQIFYLVVGVAIFMAWNVSALDVEAADLALNPAYGVAPDCDPPCITYKHARCRKKICCECEAPLNVLLPVKNPQCCEDIVEVPLCVPGCCMDVPCEKSRCGLFKRGIVWYEWSCGFKAKVVFDRCGDITVTYYGS